MYATIIETADGTELRSSFFATLSEAIGYAERMMGITKIEEIGNAIVWEKPEGENE